MDWYFSPNLWRDSGINRPTPCSHLHKIKKWQTESSGSDWADYWMNNLNYF